MVMVVVVTATVGISQFRLQGNRLAFSNGKGTAVRIAAAVIQICSGRYISFCGTKESHTQVITVCGRDTADEAAVCPTEFQCIVEYIFQFQIPAAILQRIGFLAQDLDVFQFQIANGYIGGIAGGNDDIAFTEHIIAAVPIGSCGTGRAEDIGSQAFLDTALVKDLLGDDAGFSCTRIAVIAAVVAAVSCGQVKFENSHKTASLKLFIFTLILCLA
jgi:hypothetical protein